LSSARILICGIFHLVASMLCHLLAYRCEQINAGAVQSRNIRITFGNLYWTDAPSEATVM